MGKRGPAPKPTELKKIAGNPGGYPLNEREPEFTTEKNMAPPAHLDELAKEEWGRVAPDLESNGLLSIVDRAGLAAYCTAWSRWVQAESALDKIKALDKQFHGLVVKGSKGNLITNPLVRVASDAMELMVKTAQQFGMTPSSRSQIELDPAADENPFDNFTRPPATH